MSYKKCLNDKILINEMTVSKSRLTFISPEIVVFSRIVQSLLLSLNNTLMLCRNTDYTKDKGLHQRKNVMRIKDYFKDVIPSYRECSYRIQYESFPTGFLIPQ